MKKFQWVVVLITAVAVNYALAQNTVSGHIQTVHPDTAAGHAGLTFKKDGFLKYFESDSIAGVFSTDLPSGTYGLAVKVKGAYMIEKTVDITGDTQLLIQPIMHDSVKYVYSMWPEMFDNNLKDIWALTGTHPLDDNHELFRWDDEDLPLKTVYINMPERYRWMVDTVTSRIANRTVKNKIIEVPQNQAKVKWFFTNDAHGALGYTDIFASIKNNLYVVDSAQVLIDTTLDPGIGTMFKEWGRVWLLQDLGPPEWKMSAFSNVVEFHPAEYRALNTMYLLANHTDMFQYKDTVPHTITGIKESPPNLPTGFRLSQNYPNPFNPTTTISYQLPMKSYITLKVFNLLGREVLTLVDKVEEPGYKSVNFDANRLPSAVYFYRLRAGSYIETKKLLLLK
jgi:hypothetical protein